MTIETRQARKHEVSGGRPPIYPLTVAGTGRYEPPTIMLAEEFDRRAGKCPGWSESVVGVRQRHVVTSETAIDMASEAARRALDAAGLEPASVDCIIATGAVPYQGIPTTAVLIERRLGLDGAGIPAFDVNATCLGFLVALDAAGALIAARRYETILIVAADMPSRGTSWDTPEIKAHFGDGAAAAVLRRSSDPAVGVLALGIETYSEGAEACELRVLGSRIDPHVDLERFLDESWFRMDGPLAFRITAKHLPGLIERVLAEAGVCLEQIAAVVPHQASALGIEHVRRHLGVPLNRVVNLFATHGNQVAASLPITLDVALESGIVGRGDLVLLIGTAAGISLGAAVLRL
jgi:3-oxoacyl-[acyl-carrier-protein] synthase-3